MGRGRVQLKRIENKINRQVTFSKRKSGLSKKAHEISVLCDVNVALIVFSARGKLYEYSTDSSMENILERYGHYTYAERAITEVEPESQGNLCHEYVKLKAKVDVLQKSHRHLIGEELDSLSTKELHQLEQQLQSALKHIRSKKNHLLFDSISELQHKNHLLFDSISELQHKERSVKEQNNIFEKLLEEKARLLTQHGHSDEQGQPLTSSSLPPFSMPDTLPTLNIGTYQQRDSPNEAPIYSATLPPWMLPHVNGVGQRSVNFGGNSFLASNSPT